MATLQNELLINGYIRRIQSLLSAKIIVPSDIILLCLLFFKKSLKFITIEKNRKKINIYKHDIKQTLSLQYKPKPRDKRYNDVVIEPSCYIPNISSLITFKFDAENTKSYDAILLIEHNIPAMFTPNKPSRYLSLLLFSSDSIDKDQNIECQSIHSNESLQSNIKNLVSSFDARSVQTKYVQFLNCGDKHGIIYEYNGNLLQLSLQNINEYNLSFDKVINVDEDDQIWHNWQKSYNFYKYLSMLYLNGSERIFAVYNEHGWFKFHAQKDDPEYIEQSRKCGIFDLNERKWTEIASIKFKRLYSDRHKYYHYELCKNECDNNVIYAVSNTGNTQKYDVEKNEWQEIVKDGLEFGNKLRHIVWMDNVNTICCGSGNGSYFGSLNVCEIESKWIEMTDLKNFDSKSWVISMM